MTTTEMNIILAAIKSLEGQMNHLKDTMALFASSQKELNDTVHAMLFAQEETNALLQGSINRIEVLESDYLALDAKVEDHLMLHEEQAKEVLGVK